MRLDQPSPQLPLPGISEQPQKLAIAGCDNVAPGQEVLYLGKVSGGPRFRSRGVVKQAFRRKAVSRYGPDGDLAHPLLLPVDSKSGLSLDF